MVKGADASNEARNILKEAKPGKKIVRHDGHVINGKKGMPHYQTTSSKDKSHVFYKIVKGSIGYIFYYIFDEIFGEGNPLFAGQLGESPIGQKGEDIDQDGIDDSEDVVDNRDNHIQESELNDDSAQESNSNHKKDENKKLIKVNELDEVKKYE